MDGRLERAVNFSATVPHAHSAAILHNDRIAFVGNSLQVFNETDGTSPLISIRQDDGHGISWDETNNILYVLSERACMGSG